MGSYGGPFQGQGAYFKESTLAAAGGGGLKGIHGCRKLKTKPDLTSYIPQ